MKKKILICGSSKNLGKFLSKEFKKENKVIQLSSTLKSNNKDIFQSDITDEQSLKNSFNRIKKIIKKLDVIIFTVGNSKKSDESLTKFKESFDVNFFSFVNLIHSYIQIFGYKKTKIIVISSIAGVKPIDAPIEYSVAKSALNYYSKIISKKLIAKGISINTISPGNILINGNNWSKKLKNNKSKVLTYINNNVPTKKFINPNEIYNICKLIISNENINFVGANIVIDGGQSI